MTTKEGGRSVVRSSELETGLSSSDEPVDMEVDTAASKPSSSLKPSSSKTLSSVQPWAFHALKVSCDLDEKTLFRFTDRFQFNETRIHFPRVGEKACAFAPGEVCFYKVAFLCGLRFPVSMKLYSLIYSCFCLYGSDLLTFIFAFKLPFIQSWRVGIVDELRQVLSTQRPLMTLTTSSILGLCIVISWGPSLLLTFWDLY